MRVVNSSRLSVPGGFKNSTSRNARVAVDAVIAARSQSITAACLSFGQTEPLLERLAEAQALRSSKVRA